MIILGRWIITFTLLGVVIGGLFVFKKQSFAQQQNKQSYESAIAVDAVQAKYSEYQPTITVVGTVQPDQRVTLRNQLSGTITFLNLTPGTIVEAGEILLEIEHEEEKARLIGANARLELNKKRLARNQALQKRKEVSQEQLDTAIADLKTAESDVEILKATIARKVFKAPYRAQVGFHTLQKGQYLESNTDIATLVGVNNKAWIDFELPQTYPALTLGTAIDVQAIGQSNVIPSKIIAIAPELSDESRGLLYRTEANIPDAVLKANTLVNVVVPTATPSHAVKLPELAVAASNRGNYVYVLTPDEQGTYRAAIQPVKVLNKEDHFIVVAGRFETGQLVATKGAFKLRPGAKVRLPQNANPPPKDMTITSSDSDGAGH